MPVRQAHAQWDGGLKGGRGQVRFESGAFDGAYSFGTRFESTPGTNPEELLGAAHAACFSMALAAGLERAGYPPAHIRTVARVHLEKQAEGFAVTRVDLVTEAAVPGIDASAFSDHAQKAKAGCPVSKALAGTQITLDARLTPG